MLSVGCSMFAIFFLPLLTALRPPCCHFHTPRGIIITTRPRQTFIQHHGYVAAERGLNFHRDLRRNESRRPIDVILEMHAFLRDLAQFHQRKNLVTTAVSQDRPIPIHKSMQSTKVPNHVESWPNEQVISIPEDDLGVEFAKLARADGFDAALGSYRHERWRFDQAMSSFEPPRARFCAFIRRSYFKHWPNLGNDRAACKQ